MVRARDGFGAPPRTVENQGDWYLVCRVGKAPYESAHRLRAEIPEETKRGFRTTKCGKQGRVIDLPHGRVVPCEKCERL